MNQWVKYSCLLACCHGLVVGCVVDNDDDDNQVDPSTTDAGGSGGSGGNGNGGSGGTTSGVGGTTSSGGTGTSAGAGGEENTAGAAGDSGGEDVLRKSDLVELEDGAFHEGDAPGASNGYDGEQISAISGPDSVTNGGTFTLQVTVPGASGDMDFVVAVEGDSGHFTTMATADDDGVFSIAVTLNSDVDAETINVSVAPVDADGDVGDYADIDLDVVTTGTGDVKVTLSFDQDTDLDLHVIEPDGTRIYHSATESPAGGTLDLDSNAQCEIDGIDIENIFWPTGDAPKGEYIVEVDYYEACVSDPVNFTVTVTVGGEVIDTIEGSFEADEAGGTNESRHEVGRFTVE